jgi:energy-coupling factor transport system ATP-binding protein
MDECIDADRLLVMSEGRIIADGKPAEVFADLALMEREGLSVPETTRLLHDLRAAGLELSGEALDVEGCAGEIAAALGIPQNTVLTHLRRAREQLKIQLTEAD